MSKPSGRATTWMGKFLADAWCAAFVWKKDSLIEFPITEESSGRSNAIQPRSSTTSA